MATGTDQTTADKLKQGVLGALGIALAIGLVHYGHGVGLIMALGMPPMTGFVARSIFLEMALLLPIALLLLPVRLAPKGEWIHPVAMVVSVIVIERIVGTSAGALIGAAYAHRGDASRRICEQFAGPRNVFTDRR